MFEATDAEWVVVNSAGCGALMKEYGHLLRDDPAFAARAEAFSKRVRDVSEMLTAAPLRQPLQPVPLRVAYDDPCHLLHGQKIREQPRHVLRQIPELTLLEVPESDWCCGSAGIYNLLHPETAQALLDRKMRHLARWSRSSLSQGILAVFCSCAREWRSMGSPSRCCIRSKYWREPMVRLRRGARDTGMTAQQLAPYAPSLVP